MTVVWPLRFRPLGDELLFADEAGGWFVADGAFLHRYASGRLEQHDKQMLVARGHAFEALNDLSYSSFLRRWTGRHNGKSPSLNYLILVPTLRCNLACDYCQVSRAPEGARGFDWSEETLRHVLGLINQVEGDTIKIEFQGGEPLMRLDLLEAVRQHCRERFKHATFVVCSNFVSVAAASWAFFDDDDTYLSTSIDGDLAVQSRQRTHGTEGAQAFFANVSEFINRHGPHRISALPTVDLVNPVEPSVLIETYLKFGMNSVYLRPVNRQGFARRKAAPIDETAVWANYHRAFVQAVIAHNYEHGTRLEEFYLTHALRRILRHGIDGHVDFRNPARIGDGYVVVDYDGTIYPTDEARMMSRVGQIDLSIGSVSSGIDRTKVDEINVWTANDLDPDCQHCPYQSFCGTDVVDDISRYGRIDLPRHKTWFCGRHMALFDLAFELLRSPDPQVQNSLKQWLGVEALPGYLRETHQ